MKYIFRGNIIFEYFPDKKFDKVIEHKHYDWSMFNFCKMIDEDYKLISEFFDKVYRHTKGEQVELKDINVN